MKEYLSHFSWSYLSTTTNQARHVLYPSEEMVELKGPPPLTGSVCPPPPPLGWRAAFSSSLPHAFAWACQLIHQYRKSPSTIFGAKTGQRTFHFSAYSKSQTLFVSYYREQMSNDLTYHYVMF
jgi:hypothetical protein